MVDFSIGMVQDLMVDILIIKVRVERTRSGFTTYIDKRHHLISADMLARKWSIGIDKAKRTLQSTTRDNVISALKPLTRRYRTYFLSQRPRLLNCMFYTDTLFAKEKSIVRNTCSQVFTDGVFVQITPMIYKLESGTTLDRINRDIGDTNKIFMENVTKQTGYQTEIHIVAILEIMEVQTTEPYST